MSFHVIHGSFRCWQEAWFFSGGYRSSMVVMWWFCFNLRYDDSVHRFFCAEIWIWLWVVCFFEFQKSAIRSNNKKTLFILVLRSGFEFDFLSFIVIFQRRQELGKRRSMIKKNYFLILYLFFCGHFLAFPNYLFNWSLRKKESWVFGSY